MIQIIIYGLLAGCIYTLIAIGFAIVYRTVRFFHFAHGVVYAAGAYVAYAVISCQGSGIGGQESGISSRLSIVGGQLIAAVLAGIIGAGILGVLIDWLVYKPLRKRKAPNLVFLLASFGIFIFIQNLLQLIFGADTHYSHWACKRRTSYLRSSNHRYTNNDFDCLCVPLCVSVALYQNNQAR